MVKNLTEALRFVGVFGAHTDLTDLTGFSFVGGKSHGGSTVCGFLWTHTDSTRRLFVGICVNSWQKKTPI